MSDRRWNQGMRDVHTVFGNDGCRGGASLDRSYISYALSYASTHDNANAVIGDITVVTTNSQILRQNGIGSTLARG